MKENPPALNSICQSFVFLFKWLLYLMLKMWKWLAATERCRIDRKGGKAAGIQPLCSASVQHGREAIVDTHARRAHRCLRARRWKTHIKAFTHRQAHTCVNAHTLILSLPTAPSSLSFPCKHTYPCTSIFVRTFPGIMYYPAPYPNHSN